MNNSKINNSEILFILEAKNCNPNGDPDEGNKPRMDLKTRRNLVSDVRLKRFFRDYIASTFGEEYIFVTTVEGKHVTHSERIDLAFGNLNKEEGEKKEKEETEEKREELEELKEKILEQFIDVRLFGATIPIKKTPISFIGPVQFSWGFSLHPVDLIESSTITSVLSGRKEEFGTIGKDWRVYYSLIAFYGVVSGKRAEKTKMSEEDLKVLDDLLWKSIILESTTRSKLGLWPLLYLRVEYKDAETILGDFRRFVSVNGERPRDLADLNVDFSKLIEVLSKNKDKIKKIYCRVCEYFEDKTGIKKKIEETIKEKEKIGEVQELKKEQIKKILERSKKKEGKGG